MSFSSLHTIELQLIMQHCDKAAIFALARCSHATYAAASSDFAFRCLSPMPLHPTSVLHPNTPMSLLRFCDVSLTSKKASSPNLSVCAALCVPRVHTFVSLHALSPDLLEPLLRSPSLSRLQCLSLLTLSGPMMALAATSFKHLRTLRLSDPLPEAASPHLPSFSQLNELSLNVSDTQDFHNALQSIIVCSQVHHLAWTGFSFPTQIVSLLSPSEFTRRLESLNVQSCPFASLGDADKCDAVFASCRHLTSLTLRDCHHLTPLLIAAARSCPRLQSLAVFPDDHWWRTLWNQGIDHPIAGSIPLPAEISQVLDTRRTAIAASPEFVPLTFTLACLSDSDVQADDAWVNVSCGWGDWIAIREAFAALVTSADDAAVVRFELISNDGARICGSNRGSAVSRSLPPPLPNDRGESRSHR